jgi:hypothetical protein
MDIVGHGEKVAVILHQEALETPLKEMAASVMGPIEPDRIADP